MGVEHIEPAPEERQAKPPTPAAYDEAFPESDEDFQF